MLVLGINAYSSDTSTAMLGDGQILAAVEEERFTRIKHSAGFPAQGIRYCAQASVQGGQQHARLPHHLRYFRKNTW